MEITHVSGWMEAVITATLDALFPMLRLLDEPDQSQMKCSGFPEAPEKGIRLFVFSFEMAIVRKETSGLDLLLRGRQRSGSHPRRQPFQD